MAQYAKEKAVAKEAVAKASRLAVVMRERLQDTDILQKEDRSPVTLIDLTCQALINTFIFRVFPNDEIMGEEDALLMNPKEIKIREKVINTLKEHFPKINESEILQAIGRGGSLGGPHKRFWVLDPIDGTKGLIRNEQYAPALGLVDHGKVVLGVLGCPRLPVLASSPTPLGVLFSAVTGGGTHAMNLETGEEWRVHVSNARDAENVIYCEPHPSLRSHSHLDAFKVASLLKANPQPFRLDSQVKYALVARGEASIYLRVPPGASVDEKIWDHVPGVIVVEEAGGKVTDLRGDPLDFTHGKNVPRYCGVVATNGYLHGAVLSAIRNSIDLSKFG